MSVPPDVPGFVVTSGSADELRGPAGTDLVPAVEEGTRERVTLVLLPHLDSVERERAAEVLARYAAVTSEHLADSVRLADRADALVAPAAPYVTLDRLIPAVRPASAGRVVTVVVPVAEALAALAGSGLAHGGVSEQAVSIDADGRPRLLHAGVAGALNALSPDEVAAPTADADRDDLVMLLRGIADPVSDPALDAVVDDLISQHATPAQVAERLLEAFEPEPLAPAKAATVPSAGGARTHRAQRARGPRSRVLLGLAALAVLLAAGAAIWFASSGGDATAGSAATDLPVPAEPGAASPSPSGGVSSAADSGSSAGTDLCGAPGPAPDTVPDLAENWVSVVDELNTRRSAALVTGQTSLLCQVYDPLSPGLVSDLELDAAYTDRGVRPDSLEFVVEQAELVEQEGGLLVLEITDRLEPYLLLAEDGRVVAELPGIGTETWQARLVPDSTGEQWRFG